MEAVHEGALGELAESHRHMVQEGWPRGVLPGHDSPSWGNRDEETRISFAKLGSSYQVARGSCLAFAWNSSST